MRYYDAEELRPVANLGVLIDALDAGHKGKRPEVVDGLIGPVSGRYLIRSAHDGAQTAGSKLITILPDNPAKGQPAVQAIIVLFDVADGRPLAALDATELTYWKTAADSALGSKLLSRPDAQTLLMVGAGGLAPWLVEAHLTVRPGIERVLVWNRTASKAERFVGRLNAKNIRAEVAEELEPAVRHADIVSTATMTREPLLQGDWLKPGAHVDLVGGYSRDTREADDKAILRGRLFVDCMESALDGVGDVLEPLEKGVIAKRDILGDLFDLVGKGIAGRTRPDEITIFKNAGGAHLDLMVARALIAQLDAKPA